MYFLPLESPLVVGTPERWKYAVGLIRIFSFACLNLFPVPVLKSGKLELYELRISIKTPQF